MIQDIDDFINGDTSKIDSININFKEGEKMTVNYKDSNMIKGQSRPESRESLNEKRQSVATRSNEESTD